MEIEGKLLVSRKKIAVNKESIGIDNDLTKDRIMNTFKTYCKRRKSGARFPDRKANNRLCVCHCIAGNGKRGSASYIVREVRSVRERDTERDGSDVTIVALKLAMSFALFLTKNLHLSFSPLEWR